MGEWFKGSVIPIVTTLGVKQRNVSSQTPSENNKE